jgi:ABC-type polysaccharide/polyol phosphate transport system ATPase subunit
MEPRIEFYDVSKKFRRGQLHDSLRDLVPAMARRMVGRASPEELDAKEFWAVRHVTFDVLPGKAVGIIGPNGAGKSTILKLLTRILRPTSGWCSVQGRIGALIEIAAGFHPDLTGRENVYLQGSIMGMRSADITRRFDEIVEFSGIADFIDTPVKRYSSGLNARLGFSIAAHLDPDVLIIDEVLSVGDFSFQQRAFDRVQELVRRRIPVVVVSHQLDRIAQLCTDVLLLNRGHVVMQGEARECIAAYVLKPVIGTSEPSEAAPLQFSRLTLESPQPVRSGERIQLTLAGSIAPEGLPPEIEGIVLRVRSAQNGQAVFTTSTARLGLALPTCGPFEIAVELQVNVPPGIYGVETQLWNRSRGAAVVNGPGAYVQVEPGADFNGTVQMNPTMQLRLPAPASLVARGS